MDNHSIRKLESDLWESADLLRAESKLSSNQYCMPALLGYQEINSFLRAFSIWTGMSITDYRKQSE